MTAINKVEELRFALKEAGKSIPFPGMQMNAVNAVAHYLEMGKDNGDMSRDDLAIWLRDLARQLKSVVDWRKKYSYLFEDEE